MDSQQKMGDEKTTSCCSSHPSSSRFSYGLGNHHLCLNNTSNINQDQNLQQKNQNNPADINVHCYEDPINLNISKLYNNPKLQSTIISINHFNERYNSHLNHRQERRNLQQNDVTSSSSGYSSVQTSHGSANNNPHRHDLTHHHDPPPHLNPNGNNFNNQNQHHHRRQMTPSSSSKSTINLSTYSKNSSHHRQEDLPPLHKFESCSPAESSSVSPSSSPSPHHMHNASSVPPIRVSSLIKSAKSMSSLLINHNKTGSNSSSITLTSSSTNCSSSLNSSGKQQTSSAPGNHHQQNSSQMLDENELLQIELNFKAHKTYVYVCRCLANLYFTKTDLINGGRVSSPRAHEWELNRTGVPLIVFDKGDTRSRPKRQLQLILAERGTGFALWKDIIDNLTDYKSIAATFHTLYTSSDHRKMAGLSFDSASAADDFLHQVELITSDPLNIALSAPKSKSSSLKSLKQHHKNSGTSLLSPNSCNSSGSKCSSLLSGSTHSKKSFSFFGSGSGNSCLHVSSRKKSPLKSEISSPCLFQHVTSVELSDFDRLFSMSTLMIGPPAPPSSSQLNPASSASSYSFPSASSHPPVASVTPFVVKSSPHNNPNQRSPPIDSISQLKRMNQQEDHHNPPHHHQQQHYHCNQEPQHHLSKVNLSHHHLHPHLNVHQGSDGSSVLTSSESPSPTVMIHSSPSGYGSS